MVIYLLNQVMSLSYNHKAWPDAWKQGVKPRILPGQISKTEVV
jgi:hypothetical protein